MKVCKYASMWVCEYESKKLCKFFSMKVWKYGSMQVCNYSSTRSLGAHWAPTSSWRPIGPAFCPFFDFVLAHQQQRSTRVTFFNYETRMRLSSIQSCRWRRDENFLTLNLRLRDEIEKNSPSISGIETRSRFIIFILRLWDANQKSFDLISVFETRTRVLSC